jgi:photosystem II stability/assembly factor-like uncharacterized protein
MMRRPERWLRSGFGLVAWLCLACPQAEPETSSTDQPLWRGDALSAVAVLDAGQALVAGRSGAIYRTADGGETWNRARAAASPSLLGLGWGGGQAVWAVAEGAVLLSQDRGRSWRSVGFEGEAEVSGLRAVAAVGERGAVVVGERALVLVTRDGGASWQSGDLAPVIDREPRRGDGPTLTAVECGAGMAV